jgi:hypothetical protein
MYTVVDDMEASVDNTIAVAGNYKVADREVGVAIAVAKTNLEGYCNFRRIQYQRRLRNYSSGTHTFAASVTFPHYHSRKITVHTYYTTRHRLRKCVGKVQEE